MKTIAPIIVLGILLAMPSPQAAEDAKIYRGLLIVAPEAETFTPCGSNNSLWLDYSEFPREPLAKKYRELTKKPYESTFVVIKGIIGPALDCGFCEKYMGSFKILEVLEHRRTSGSDCKASHISPNPDVPKNGVPVASLLRGKAYAPDARR